MRFFCESIFRKLGSLTSSTIYDTILLNEMYILYSETIGVRLVSKLHRYFVGKLKNRLDIEAVSLWLKAGAGPCDADAAYNMIG